MNNMLIVLIGFSETRLVQQTKLIELIKQPNMVEIDFGTFLFFFRFSEILIPVFSFHHEKPSGCNTLLWQFSTFCFNQWRVLILDPGIIFILFSNVVFTAFVTEQYVNQASFSYFVLDLLN